MCVVIKDKVAERVFKEKKTKRKQQNGKKYLMKGSITSTLHQKNLTVGALKR
jgi:hypothetical protein